MKNRHQTTSNNNHTPARKTPGSNPPGPRAARPAIAASERRGVPGSQHAINPPIHQAINPPPGCGFNGPKIENVLGHNAHERILEIHYAIASETYPNLAGLGANLEVSRKTLKRDLKRMKEYWGLPIRYDRDRRGYHYTEPVDQFPGVPSVTEAEIFALLVAHKAIEQYHATPFHQPLHRAFQKLISQLDRKVRFSLQDFDSVLSFRSFAPELVDLQRFDSVSRALQQERELRFEYRKPGEKHSALRHVQPYHLCCIENAWHLIAYDLDRADFRDFVLCRISGAVAVGEPFQKVHRLDLEKQLAGSLTAYKGDGDYEIVVEFDHWATDFLQGRLWHHSQKIEPLADGASRMTMRLTALQEVERWILSWGTHATAVGPVELVQRVGKIARELGGRYPEVKSSSSSSSSSVPG